MTAIKTTLIFTAITAVFLIPHFVAGMYAEPKAPAAECAKAA
jgi:hypothetical protein